MTTFQDFDWADEVVHAGFGQKWIIDELFQGDNVKALDAAEATVAKRAVYMDRFDKEGMCRRQVALLVIIKELNRLLIDFGKGFPYGLNRQPLSLIRVKPATGSAVCPK